MTRAAFLAAGLLTVLLVTPGCERDDPVSFAADVKPLLDQHCTGCHVPGQAGYETSGLATDSYAGLMKGTKFGPVVVAGDSFNSTLVVLIEGRADPSINMPHGSLRELNEQEVAIIRRWIDGGAMND
jgi:hypothetical protein